MDFDEKILKSCVENATLKSVVLVLSMTCNFEETRKREKEIEKLRVTYLLFYSDDRKIN